MSDTKDDAPSPFYIFMSGEGGMGKTHTIHAIYQTGVRVIRTPGQDPDKATILLYQQEKQQQTFPVQLFIQPFLSQLRTKVNGQLQYTKLHHLKPYSVCEIRIKN